MRAAAEGRPSVLAVDVGGSHVKAMLSGERERRRFDSGPGLTPQEMVEGVRGLADGWSFERVSVGIPTPVRGDKAITDPVNLGDGWVGFDFEAAFGVPTKVVNDAVMQAIGSYDGGRMLYLGLGTGLGSAMIVDDVIVPMELGHLPFRRATFEEYVGRAARDRLGPKRWREAVHQALKHLSTALLPDYVVLGGGLADELEKLPENVRVGGNELAFLGGYRLWE
jgi:predicted NBD/HSP70 family sugar kinase